MDLTDKAPDWILREVFGVAQSPLMQLSRESHDFRWTDHRRADNWTVKSGYLDALHQVSSREQATTFAERNKIKLLPEGGMHFRSNAELYIRASPMPISELVKGMQDLYGITLSGNVTANVGYGTLLFERLVARPAVEREPRLPDPASMATLVITNISLSEVPEMAELVLYHLRSCFRDVHFSFHPLPQVYSAPPIDEPDSCAPPCILSDVKPRSERPEAIAFFNRAVESEPIAAFLYFYRVLEACFDEVLNDEIVAWKSLPTRELFRNLRRLIKQEDTRGLRLVLGAIVRQSDLDQWSTQSLIQAATADSLTEAIYKRRNSIAHGRRGQHQELLVPFAFRRASQHSDWVLIMRQLAVAALEKWFFK